MTNRKTYTDEDILSMKKVTPQIAAAYLNVSDDRIREGIQTGAFPFGTYDTGPGGNKRSFDIRPKALVEYNNHGLRPEVDPNLIAELVVEKFMNVLGGRTNDTVSNR